jgi:hypothetical protein
LLCWLTLVQTRRNELRGAGKTGQRGMSWLWRMFGVCQRKAMDEQQVAFRQDWASHNLAVRGEKLMEERKFEGGPKGVKGHSAQS